MMKRLMTICASALAAMLFIGCEAPVNESEQGLRTFSAAAEGVATRSSIDGTVVSWAEGDVVSILGEHTLTSAVASDITGGGKFARLTATGVQDELVYAVHPHAESNRLSGSTVCTMIPASCDGSFNSANVSVARSEGDELVFHNASGVFRFSVSDPCVTRVEIAAPAIAGAIEVTLDGGFSHAAGADIQDKVTVEPVTRMTDLYAAVRPGQYAAGSLIFNCYDKSGALVDSFTYEKPLTVYAGDLVAWGDLAEHSTLGKDSISILAIGNSFSVDAMQYLYQMLKQAGYKTVYLGNLYIGGCTLATHDSNIASDAKAYQYYTNSAGSWTSVTGYSAVQAIKSRAWDYISLQQASGYSGLADSYEPHIGNIVSAVKSYCPGARLMWHMTWAYQGNSAHSDFPKYGNSQQTMYSGILDAVQSKVLTRDDFSFVIPCGTVIQNLRTSYLGDKITRDGYHMSYELGRYATALMWARQISHCDLSKITYKPSFSKFVYSSKCVAAIKDAVENAYAHPYEVTQSAYPPEYVTVPNESLRAQIAAAGYNPDDYVEKKIGLEFYSYYNSMTNNQATYSATISSNIISKDSGSSASNIDQFSATVDFFTRADIPVGSLIAVREGYQYRPEGWTNISSTVNSSSARPQNVSTPVVKVTDTWWGNRYFRAFNISMVGVSHMTEAQMQSTTSAFSIFVPKN